MSSKPVVTAYINPANSQQLLDLAKITLPDGTPAIDFVCLFAGNYASADTPYLRANNNNPATTNPLNTNIQAVLDDGSTSALQAAGIKVLLTVTNGWNSVGW